MLKKGPNVTNEDGNFWEVEWVHVYVGKILIDLSPLQEEAH